MQKNRKKKVNYYSKDSLLRAKSALQDEENVIRIGTSLITPTGFLIEIWPKIHERCPNLKFQLVPFENTPENAREILMNLGQNIDLVAGLFDAETLKQRKCTGLELSKEPIRCAVSIHHRLSERSSVSVQDLFGDNLMMIRRGWNSYVDSLRDDIERNYSQIKIIDFPFYDVNVFNQCENSKDILMAVGSWESVHPLLRILKVDWDYVIPFGILYSPSPSDHVLSFIHAVSQVFGLES